jgi:phosphomevalonate kinase
MNFPLNNPLILLQTIRSKMREMGTLSGVPVEPIEQTQLLDLCVSQPGVIGGGVPGGMSL